MAIEITMRSNDQLPTLAVAIETDMGIPIDLTGATKVDFVLTNEDGDDPRVVADRPNPRLVLPGMLLDAAHGVVAYDWMIVDALRPGIVQLVIVVYTPTGTVTSPTDRSARIIVRPDVTAILEGGPVPGRYDLSIYRGDTYGWRFILWQDAAKTIPLNLAGATAKAQIRDHPSGGLLVPIACTVTLPNIVDTRLESADSQHCPTKGVWDLQITFPSTAVRTVVSGSVVTTPDVTDSRPVFTTSGSR